MPKCEGPPSTATATTAAGGITLAQLYSTASYAAHDLSGIGLVTNDLSGANLSGQNLTGANLNHADLTNADLSRAVVTVAAFDGANSPARTVRRHPDRETPITPT